jgi:hypothetical protein
MKYTVNNKEPLFLLASLSAAQSKQTSFFPLQGIHSYIKKHNIKQKIQLNFCYVPCLVKFLSLHPQHFNYINCFCPSLLCSILYSHRFGHQNNYNCSGSPSPSLSLSLSNYEYVKRSSTPGMVQ